MRFYFNFFPGRGEGVFTRAGLFPTRGTGLRQCVRVQVYTQIRENLGLTFLSKEDSCLLLDDATAATTLFLSPATTLVSDIIF